MTGTGLMAEFLDPFDVSKPNLHDTKAEFLKEKNAVEAAIKNSRELLDFLISAHKDEESLDPAAKRVCEAADSGAKAKWRNQTYDTVTDLINRNAVDVGLSFTSVFILADLLGQFYERQKELANQEATFWSLNSRAPDYYARTIALRFAQLVARNTGKKPTLGTSRDGSHPSTEFGRALEEIFAILGIETNFRHPAKWAIGELTEDDLKPPNALRLGGLPGLGSRELLKRNRLFEVATALSKDSEE